MGAKHLTQYNFVKHREGKYVRTIQVPCGFFYFEVIYEQKSARLNRHEIWKMDSDRTR